MPRRKKATVLEKRSAFALTLTRVHAVATVLEAALELVQDEEESLHIDVTSGYPHLGKPNKTTPGHMLLIEMGLLQVSVEAWVEFGFHDPQVDDLLLHKGHRKRIVRARNALFHAGFVDQVVHASDPRDESFVQWMMDLKQAMTEGSRRWFAENLPAPRKTNGLH